MTSAALFLTPAAPAGRGIWDQSRHLAFAICGLAFALRIAAFFALGRAHRPDVWESEAIATSLAEGHGFVYQFLGTTYRSYLEPLYPAFCASLYTLTGHSFVALGVAQALLGSALVWLVFVCGRRVGGDRPALWAALLTAAHPALVVYATKFHPFILDSLLLALVAAACLLFSDARPWRSVVLIGGAVGLCALSRATVLACLPVIGWWVWDRSAGPPRAKVGQLAALALMAALVMSPWVLRNYHVPDRFMLTRSGTSLVFWLGNNPYRFTGSAATPDGRALYDLMPPADRAHLETLDELGQQDFFLAQARRHVREHPLGFVQRWAVKWYYFWWQTPQAGRLYPAAGLRVYQVYYLAIVALAIGGVVGNWRRHEVVLLVGLCLSIAALQSAYYIEGRHRLAIEPLLLILTGMALSSLRGRDGQLLPWGKKVTS